MPRIVPPEELKFRLKLGVQRLPRAILRDLAGAADKREMALKLAQDILFAEMERYSFTAGEVLPNHGDKPGETLKAQGEH